MNLHNAGRDTTVHAIRACQNAVTLASILLLIPTQGYAFTLFSAYMETPLANITKLLKGAAFGSFGLSHSAKAGIIKPLGACKLALWRMKTSGFSPGTQQTWETLC